MSDKYMDYKKIKRILLVVMTLAVVGSSSCAFAEGYKYKITDPRYNTAVQYTTPQDTYNNNRPLANPADKKKQRTQLLIILLMIVVPSILIYTTIKNIEPKSQYRKKLLSEEFKETFRAIMAVVINILLVISKKVAEIFKAIAGETSKSKMQSYSGPVVHTSAPKKIKANEFVKEDSVNELNEVNETKEENAKIEAPNSQEEKPDLSKNIQKFSKANISSYVSEKNSVEKTEFSINEYLSSPIQKPHNPVLLSSSKLTRNKGLCLVQYRNKVSLIGYINKKVFVLAQFNSLSTNEIRSRLAENEGENERYIVKLGNYKALLEVSENNMELLLEL